MHRTAFGFAWVAGAGAAVLGWLAAAPVPAAAAPPQVLWAEPNEPSAGEALAPTSQPATQPAGPRANLLPGIAVDKARRRVMVDCVTLQPGIPLELVACTPGTRDHEAIVTVRARPQHIHLALLLCGFEPGHPAGRDEKTDKEIPATGDPIDLLVQWTDPKTGQQRTCPLQDWMAPSNPANPMPQLHFLFTGSRQFEDGVYWADREGSVVSISNFPDALIDLSGEHTRDNAQLEFKSNDQTMPPVGTRCQMILLPPAALRVELDRFGKIAVAGKPVSPSRLAALLAAHKRARDDARIELVVAADAVKADADKLLAALAAAGFPAGRIDRRVPTTQSGAFEFPINDPWAAIDLLTGQWREHRQTISANILAQQQWFEQIDARRRLLTRQYRELTDYLDRSRQQLRQAATDLRTGR